VYALDVGYGQIDYRLRSDPRVVVIERTNARYVTALPEPVSLIVIDVSFIPLRTLLPVLRGWLTETADLIPLIKAQFEAGKDAVGKGGVVRDPAVHRRVLQDVLDAAQEAGYHVWGLIPSPLKGPAGNIEFLTWLSTEAAQTNLDDLITAALAAAPATETAEATEATEATAATEADPEDA